jgi:hypothetical protein
MPLSTRSTVPHLPPRPTAHGFEQIAGLVADRFDDGAGDFGVPNCAWIKDRAARIGIPIGRAKSHEGRHHTCSAD